MEIWRFENVEMKEFVSIRIRILRIIELTEFLFFHVRIGLDLSARILRQSIYKKIANYITVLMRFLLSSK